MKSKMIHELIIFSCLFIILFAGMHLYSCKEKQLTLSDETTTVVSVMGDNSLLGVVYINQVDLSVKNDKLNATYFEIAFEDMGGLEEYEQKTSPIQIKLYKDNNGEDEEVTLKEKMGENKTTLYYAQNFTSDGDLRVEVTYSYGTNSQKGELVIEKQNVTE